MRTAIQITTVLAAVALAGCASTEGPSLSRKSRVGKRKRAHDYTVAGIESLMGRKRYVEAIRVATRLISKEQDKKTLLDARLLQGEALMRLGRYTDAIRVFDEVTQNPGAKAAIAWLWKGHCHYMNRQSDRKGLLKATECYAVVIRHSKTDRQLRKEAGMWMVECRRKLKQTSARADQRDADIQKAYELFRQLAEEYPDSAWQKGLMSDPQGDFWRPEEKERIMRGEQP